MTEQKTLIDISSPSYLNVCLSHEDVNFLPDGRIPLRNLVKALEEYVGAYGGQGNLKIAMYYKDDGEIKPLLPQEGEVSERGNV